jgi:Fungal chitosanase of glycosyl hydrolase group 75
MARPQRNKRKTPKMKNLIYKSKRFGRILLSAAAMVILAALAFPQDVACQKTPVAEHYGKIQPWRTGQAVGFTSPGLAVDADGAPNSYLVDGKGLSDTCDGVVALVKGKRVNKKTDPEHWYAICQQAWKDAQASGDFSKVAIFGFLVDKHNHPLVQGAGDPLPGKAYISTTSMTVKGTPDGTQRHWVDAVKIPYVVLPGDFVKAYHVKPGDLAVVYRPKTQAVAFGVFADGGDLGEASVKLHTDLGSSPIVTKDGVARAKAGIPDHVVTIVFPGTNVPSSVDADEWNKQIHQAGEDALKKWGGLPRLQSCAK